jgi:porin
MGAIGSYRFESASVSLWIYDPVDRTNDYTPGDLFKNGVTFYLTPSWAMTMAGRPTTFSLTGIYTTKSGVDFKEISESVRAGLTPSTKEGSYSVGFQILHMLHVDPANPRKGWGVHVKGAVSDGNPNYVQRSIIAGIGGTGLFKGRELDSFGIGYFYYNLSDSLQDTLSPKSERFGDEQGAEIYYSYAVTPWCYVTGDLQYIEPPRNSLKNAFIAGLRLNVRF